MIIAYPCMEIINNFEPYGYELDRSPIEIDQGWRQISVKYQDKTIVFDTCDCKVLTGEVEEGMYRLQINGNGSYIMYYDDVIAGFYKVSSDKN